MMMMLICNFLEFDADEGDAFDLNRIFLLLSSLIEGVPNNGTRQSEVVEESKIETKCPKVRKAASNKWRDSEPLRFLPCSHSRARVVPVVSVQRSQKGCFKILSSVGNQTLFINTG